MDIPRLRLRNQHLSHPTFKKASEVVSWLGAVQAQEYQGGLWSIGMRMKHATEVDVEEALARKTIIRTWPMRGTLHFVPAEDALWMLRLLAARVIKRYASYIKQFDLDESDFARSKELLYKALQGGKQLTRKEMYATLEAGNIKTSGGRGLWVLGPLAQEGFLCFGIREGKQQRFTLLSEWVPNPKKLSGDEALAEITCRYFTSHGPAMVQDLMFWSGLTSTEVKAGIEMVKSALTPETIDGKTYWMSKDARTVKNLPLTVFLLPTYDEYLIGYKDRSASIDRDYLKLWVNRSSDIFYSPIVSDGRVVGSWRRTLKKGKVLIETKPLNTFNNKETQGLKSAAERYGKFLGLPVVPY